MNKVVSYIYFLFLWFFLASSRDRNSGDDRNLGSPAKLKKFNFPA